ncbi:hypothetical protein [Sphingomonas quercus]|uniref:Uncharacterized protein n=1 Tax=Sphingomonas quercus TaxID=2842451 RepID=A0ABS6BE64_9SPHN|nr:hypothetical protein [Sphingomonas quercus]MBU3076604.1 hypothetical protein [Sphingomonas quercus]
MHAPRLFENDESVRRIGEGLLDHSLPKAEWTHEAHIAASFWLVAERPDIDVDAEIAEIISGYNVATGGVNDDANGYHDTITRCFLAGVRAHAMLALGGTLADRVNALLESEAGRRDWPLRFYSRERLFSVEARRGYVEPDLRPLP